MDKLKKYSIWITLFMVVSCSNLSRICSHGTKNDRFNYKEGRKINFAMANPLFTGQHEVAWGDLSPQAPVRIHWDTLLDVTFKPRYNKEYDMEVFYPVFGGSIRKLKGKELYITGYIIPLNPPEGLYAISRYNYAACFFCGGAGPESVISLKFKTKPRRYKTDEYLTMKGILDLNDSNINDFIYIFRDTEEFSRP